MKWFKKHNWGEWNYDYGIILNVSGFPVKRKIKYRKCLDCNKEQLK